MPLRLELLWLVVPWLPNLSWGLVFLCSSGSSSQHWQLWTCFQNQEEDGPVASDLKPGLLANSSQTPASLPDPTYVP